MSAAGEPNLAPFSFFMVGGIDPPSLAFCPILGKDGRKKTSLVNIEETQEFVVNLVTRPMAERMNTTSVDYPDGYEKWGLSGLTPVPSSYVKPARVTESAVQFECRLFQVVSHGASHYVIGEVIVAHIDEELLTEDGSLRPFEPIARLGGAQYLDLDGGKVFEMIRPSPVAESS